MDKYNVKEIQGIFFQGQIFDAYAKFESFCPQQRKKSFYALYLTAGLSDMIDGPVARKTGSASDFGSDCLHSCNNCRNPGRTFYPTKNQKYSIIIKVMKVIILNGQMGVGKTAVGKYIAEHTPGGR